MAPRGLLLTETLHFWKRQDDYDAPPADDGAAVVTAAAVL